MYSQTRFGLESRFVLLGVPSDYFLPQSWIDVKGFRDSKPLMSEADDRCIKVIARATAEEVRFDDLMSEDSLFRADFLPSQGVLRGRVDGIFRDPLFLTFEGGMGTMESELQIAN